jgi:ribosomal protein L37E
MKYPIKCDLCNSTNIVACDETEQELCFYCNRCGEMFDIAKSRDDQNAWCDSAHICARCGLNKATLFIDGSNSCNECEFNRAARAAKGE